MNLLFRILYAQKCTSTHHFLAMDALRYLRTHDTDNWARMFLAEIEQYMDGAKAPDRKFRDFRNHVLHVTENYWGGAVPAAELWYRRFVKCLQAGDWRRAVYSAGVLTHYVSDPFMPLHTGQTEHEGAVHRIIEWATAKAYRDLIATLPAVRGIHNWKPPADADSADWLALLVIDAATHAHAAYDVLIDHYDPERGRKNAVTGMDTTCSETIANLLGRCIRALSYILSRGINEAAVRVPRKNVSAATVLSGLSTPVFFLTRRLAHRADRMAVKEILSEQRRNGRVIESLPSEQREVRSAHAQEILGVPESQLEYVPVRKPGSAFHIATPEEKRARRLRRSRSSVARQSDRASPASQATPSFRLELRNRVVDAPSIGPKTAKHLRGIGIHSVDDLLRADPTDAQARLGVRWITDDVIISWQQQAALVCDVPGIRGTDAQLLVAVGVTSASELSRQDAGTVHQLILDFAATPAGERIVRGGQLPDQHQIIRWIQSVTAPVRRAA